MYRLVTSTTLANLTDPLCSFTDQGSIVTMQVIDCGDILSAKLLSFSGKKVNDHALLEWVTANEQEPLLFQVLRSSDGTHFSLINTLSSYNDPNGENRQYRFTDPFPIQGGKTFYRILMKNNSGQSVMSKTIMLSEEGNKLMFLSVINPFSNRLSFELYSDKAGDARMELIDGSGRTVMQQNIKLGEGSNSVEMENTGKLAAGLYYLRVFTNDAFIQKRVLKSMTN
jgi:hypothetical protein